MTFFDLFSKFEYNKHKIYDTQVVLKYYLRRHAKLFVIWIIFQISILMLFEIKNDTKEKDKKVAIEISHLKLEL